MVPPRTNGRPRIEQTQLVDLDQAIRELETARAELNAAKAIRDKRTRVKARVEPLARVELARRFLVGVLEQGGWRVEPSR